MATATTVYFYTYRQAKAKVKRLGINSVIEYRERYKEDERLPAAPDDVYKATWVDWPEFFDKSQYRRTKYRTVAEASEAAQEMGITTKAEYVERYTEDPSLPSTPNKAYGARWKGWLLFLGRVLPYKTFAKTRRAARKLEIKTKVEYRERYKEDPCLVSNPDLTFKSNWTGWNDFLGT